MSKKSIQILRGSVNYDPSKSEELLLDGQLFYSKKYNQMYIGDGNTPLNKLKPEITKGLQCGDGDLSLKIKDIDSYAKRVFRIIIPNSSFKFSFEPELTYIVRPSNGDALYLYNKETHSIKMNMSVGESPEKNGTFNILYDNDNVTSSHVLSYTIYSDGTVDVTATNTFGDVSETLNITDNCNVINRVNNVTGAQSFAIGTCNNIGSKASFNIGTYNINKGDNSLILGTSNEIYDNNSIIGGNNAIITKNTNLKNGSLTLTQNNINIAQYSIVEGKANAVFGRGQDINNFRFEILQDTYDASFERVIESKIKLSTDSLKELRKNNTSNFGSSHLVQGDSNLQSGVGNMIIGNANIQSGNTNTLTGNYDSVSGQKNNLSSNYSMVGGYGNNVSSPYSFVHGLGLEVENSSALPKSVLGKYNIKYDSSYDKVPIFAIGNGINNDNRSDAFEIYSDGRAKVFAAPIDDNDVVRNIEFKQISENLNSILGDLNSSFFEFIYN